MSALPSDPLLRIEMIAREVLGHLTIHASYGEEATRHPDPDWTCQLVWATGQPAEPIQSFFGAGSTLAFAVAHVLAQIDAAIQALDQEEDTP